MADNKLKDQDSVWNQLDYEHDALIEASAGTGKTYALENIVRKLVKEKGYLPESILLVTFTEKAAGELKDRIRKALQDDGPLPAGFDEMMICTIHSFCQRLLTEYAFENGVPMKSEIGGDSKTLAHQAVLEALKDEGFAQRYKDTLLDVMEESGFKTIDELVKYTEGIVANGTYEKKQKSMDEAILSAKKEVFSAAHELSALSMRNFGHGDVGKAIVDNAGFAKGPTKFYKWLSANFKKLMGTDDLKIDEVVNAFIDDGIGKDVEKSANNKIKSWMKRPTDGGSKPIFDFIPEYVQPLKSFMSAIARVGEYNRRVQQHKIVFKLANIAMPRFLELKKAAALLTFDDMVMRAAEVVTRTPQDEGERLAQQSFFKVIRKRYRVALVDEFQDTDAHQWDIFRTLFSSKVNKVDDEKQGFLIVVGDPKQAIYSFRGADVKVYCSARDQIDQRKTLDETYRSKKSLVEAFNIIFRDDGGSYDKRGSDWFRDGVAGAGIGYGEVEYPQGNKKFLGLKEVPGQEAAVLLLESMPGRIQPSTRSNGGFGNKNACLPVFMENAAKEMLYLKSLDKAYSIQVKKKDGEEYETKECRFSYGDMCVLVESKNDAAVVRRILAKNGIPYGQYKQQGIYDSPEAEGVLALLDYLARPSGTGHRAALLLSPIFRVHPSGLAARTKQDESAFDKLMEELQELVEKKMWNEFFEKVMSDERTALTHPTTDVCAFNRTRAAVRQIFDALLSEKGSLARNVSEFASLLREWRKNDKASGEDGALYRKESEADRVQIMTMHASKGLQFPVVFLAYGFSGLVKKETPEDERPALLEERRRLLYVALTRAEHRLYLPWSKRAWKWTIGEGSGLGSVGSALLVGSDPKHTNGFLGRAIEVYFSGKEDSAFAPERNTVPPQPSTDVHCDDAERYPMVGDVNVPRLKGRRVRWDSFTAIPQGGASPEGDEAKNHLSAENGAEGRLPEPPDPAVKAKTLLPRNNVSGDVFHDIMEALCKNDPEDVDFTTACGDDMEKDDSPLMELIRKFMRKHSLANRKGDGDSADMTTEKVLLRMVQNVLKTPIAIGETKPFLLKDIPKKDRLAEVEFVVDEQNLLIGLPKDREGAMNGKIDLLVRKDNKVFVLDWKTNSLTDYKDKTVAEKMDEKGYHLQYKIYSLAAAKWLKPRGLTLGGVAYLFVRGGEVGERSGVFAKAFDETTLEGFRKEISKMGYFAGKKEDA